MLFELRFCNLSIVQGAFQHHDLIFQCLFRIKMLVLEVGPQSRQGALCLFSLDVAGCPFVLEFTLELRHIRLPLLNRSLKLNLQLVELILQLFNLLLACFEIVALVANNALVPL